MLGTKNDYGYRVENHSTTTQYKVYAKNSIGSTSYSEKHSLMLSEI